MFVLINKIIYLYKEIKMNNKIKINTNNYILGTDILHNYCINKYNIKQQLYQIKKIPDSLNLILQFI